MLKIAVLADVHSNYLALQACINKAIDAIVMTKSFAEIYMRGSFYIG